MSSDDYLDSGDEHKRRKLSKLAGPTGRQKRQKGARHKEINVSASTPLLQQNIEHSLQCIEFNVRPREFDDFFEERILPDYLHRRNIMLSKRGGRDENGTSLRMLSNFERSALSRSFGVQAERLEDSAVQTTLFRKLSYPSQEKEEPSNANNSLRECFPMGRHIHKSLEYLESLKDRRTTPLVSSFLSRLVASSRSETSSLLAVDWLTESPWSALMCDIRVHYELAHPDRECPRAGKAPVLFSSLQSWHLPQVHDLLVATFWEGIDVSDALDYWPERCTVVATYKRLVVGLVIISSPRETYITYLTVKPGWDNSRIATSLLYHLIKLNPNQDITLHVSANNPAMLLYNRFGFKAEEFVVGFYQEYLDSQSRASKNAFRLRLRHN